MGMSRRGLIAGLASMPAAGAQVTPAPALSIETLRHVSSMQGTNLNDERLRILRPVLERRARQLQQLRGAELDDAVEPTQGILIG